jgi:ABC-type transport system involved in multi-copper enzyme maturation permease subunit
MIATIVSHQLRALRRQKAIGVLLGTLIGVNVLAGVLGWASKLTIGGVYEESVKLLAARGLSAPPNPFLLKPPLSLLSNEIIYVTMIGALAALVLGHLVIVEDEIGGNGRLLFSRQTSRSQFALGKVASVAVVLGLGMVACLLVSVVAVILVNRSLLSSDDGLRVGLFFSCSWLYLMVFALIGMLTVLVSRRRSLGMLFGFGVWLVITFVVPQFTSGLRPSQSLNPIVDPVSTSQTFFNVTAKLRPVSIAEQFKTASRSILKTSPAQGAGETLVRMIPLAAFALLLIVAVHRAICRHDYSRSLDE